MRAGDWYWLVWFAVGFGVPETVGLATRWPTLSETWHRINSTAPTWAAVLMHAALAGALLWLLAAHWIRTRPGFGDDALAIAVGVAFGAVTAVTKRRRERS